MTASRRRRLRIWARDWSRRSATSFELASWIACWIMAARLGAQNSARCDRRNSVRLVRLAQRSPANVNTGTPCQIASHDVVLPLYRDGSERFLDDANVRVDNSRVGHKIISAVCREHIAWTCKISLRSACPAVSKLYSGRMRNRRGELALDTRGSGAL